MSVFQEEDDVAFTPEQLRTELEDAERRLRDALKKMADATAHARKIEAQRDAYRILLEATAGSANAPPVGATATPPEKTNKTEMIRRIIREAGTRGIEPVGIWKAVQKSGTQMRRQYLYLTLNRLVEQGTVNKRSGKYSMEAVQ